VVKVIGHFWLMAFYDTWNLLVGFLKYIAGIMGKIPRFSEKLV
jgi:hypothetical protein